MKGVTGSHQPFTNLSPPLISTHQSFTLACKTCCEGSRNEVFTRLYMRNFLPEKAFTRSQSGRFLLSSNCFKCEGLGFQAFTRLYCDKPAVNGWRVKPSHWKLLKIRRKEPSCERVNTFLRIKKAYRGEWTVGTVNGNLIPGIAGVCQLPKLLLLIPDSPVSRLCSFRWQWRW